MNGLETNSLYLVIFKILKLDDGRRYTFESYILGVLQSDETKTFEITPKYEESAPAL